MKLHQKIHRKISKVESAKTELYIFLSVKRNTSHFQEVISTPYIVFTKAKACDWLVTRKYFLSPVSIISIRFTSISYYVMMTCSCPWAIGQACHTLHSTCRLWSRILRLRVDHFGFRVWGSSYWIMLVWHSSCLVGCSEKKMFDWYLIPYFPAGVPWFWSSDRSNQQNL